MNHVNKRIDRLEASIASMSDPPDNGDILDPAKLTADELATWERLHDRLMTDADSLSVDELRGYIALSEKARVDMGQQSRRPTADSA